MAQGKISNRQKMINLMYLIFIAMLAMNIDREVLRSFASVNETLEEVGIQTNNTNASFYAGVEKANPENKVKADTIKSTVNNFIAYIESIKKEITDNTKINLGDENLDYKKLESTDKLNNYFFKGGKPTAKANEFIQKIEEFKQFALSHNKDIKGIDSIRIDKFFTANKIMKNGKSWLIEKFYDQPGVASLTNLSALQMSARNEESIMIYDLLENKVVDQAVVINQVIPSSTTTTGTSSTYTPPVVNNNTSTKTVTAGDSKVVFQTGVVYLGYENPINPAGAGARPESVKATSSNGSLSNQGNGSFIFVPSSLGTATVNVSCLNVNGSPVSGTATYQVKPPPPPQGKVRGATSLRLPKNSAASVSVEVDWGSTFIYPITATVTSFDVKIPGGLTIPCSGNRMNAEASAKIKAARPGDKVTIFNIKAKTDKGAIVTGSNVEITLQ